MTDTTTNEIGPSFSPEEEAFFSSGGDSAIPPEAGADTAGGDVGAIDPDKSLAADKAGDRGKEPEKMVSLAALHEERATRKARDADLRKAQTELAELKGKFSIIERLNLPPGENDPAAAVKPTPEEDIFGAVKATDETVAQLQKRLDDADAATKAATEQTTFVNNYKADAAKFEATKPDFKKAYDFILNSRAEELKAIGYDTPEALHNALNADEFAIAEMAFSKGKSPAEMLYALAVQRGYKTAAAPVDPAAGDAKPGEGSAAERLDTIAAGQAANKSLSNLGGEAPGGEMTAAQLIAMPMAEFEAWTEKNPAKAKRLMGG